MAFKTNFSNGGANDRASLNKFYQAGTPLGNVFYVGSTATGASATGPGWSPDNAFTTIDAAVGQCTADQGDLILVLPGHVETVSAAGSLDLDVAGITIRGLGTGNAMAKVDFTTADTADVDIDAANVTIENIQFEASFADIAAAIDVNADNCTLLNCKFLSPTTNENAVIWILGATATSSDYLTVEDCWFEGKDAANTHAISFAAGTPNGVVIRNSVFHVFAETAVIGGTGAVTNILIEGNYIQNADTDADACINLPANSTGIVAYNSVGAALACNATTNITCGAGVVLIENYSVDTGDRQGVLDPAGT